MVTMANHDTAALLRLMGHQHGIATRAQARSIDVSDGQLKRLTAAGVLEVAGRGILRQVGAPPTWEQRVWSALLRTGDGIVSHRAAGRLWSLEGCDRAPVELSVSHGRRTRGVSVALHHSTDLRGEPRLRRGGFPVTSATRTLVDLGAVVREAQLEVALDDALRRGLTTYDRLWTAIARLGRPGRSGVPQLRDLLLSRGDVAGLTDTGFETLVLRALREHGLPRPMVQHELYDTDGQFVMRFDAAYVAEKVGVEADSKRWHGTDSRFESDREQRAVAAALGWSVVPITWRQVTTRPAWVGETVGRALAVAARRAA